MKSGFLLKTKEVSPQRATSTQSKPNELKLFPNYNVLRKELEEVFETLKFETNTVKKIIPALLQNFSNTEKNEQGVYLGYELAYHDTFQYLEGTPAQITNFMLFEDCGIKEKLINKLLTYATR
tara:strand:+ start:125 stop:493 length:369 start_codon:yes stop_codon:yes gene_type:complete